MEKRPNKPGPVAAFFRKPYRYAAVFSVFLTAVVAFTLLETFVIPRAMQAVPGNSAPEQSSAAETPVSSEGGATELSSATESGIREAVTPEDEVAEEAAPVAPVITDDSYEDENIEISIETFRAYDTEVYIADVRVSDVAYFKTAMAHDTYGRNIKETTSLIAEGMDAIFAVNGDCYGSRDEGWTLRNGILYRSGAGDEALLMDREGNLSRNSDKAAIEGQAQNLLQIWSFGPALVDGGEISVTKGQEIMGRSSNSNPRTAIGQVGKLHYVFIVSDGRTDESAGLSLYELAELFEERGCSFAYNLDGGGSSAMYFNGRVVNKPTTGGNRIAERGVSDIVYIGY